MAGQGRLCPLCNETSSADFCPTHGVPTLVVADLEGPPAPIEIGTIIGGRYRIERLLSQGGMGAVLIATQLGIGRTVVVKVVKSASEALLNHLRRFYREAMAMSRLNHPNIVRVHEFGVDPPTRAPYLIMEHVEGRTLRDIVDQEGPLSERRAARLLTQVARALFEAHNHGVLHRDLKPRNIMVRQLADGEELVKVLDFGLAKINEDENAQPPLTQPGKTIGTPSYMSPEQVVSGEQDGRTDLYGLGCVLYMVLTGSAPFVGADLIDTMRMHLQRQPPALPDRLADGQPPSELLKTLYSRLLAKRKNERPESAAEVARDLATIAEGRIELPKIQPLPKLQPLPRAASKDDSDAIVTIPAEGTALTELGQLADSPDLAYALGSGVAPREKSDEKVPVQPRPKTDRSNPDVDAWTTVLPSSLDPADAGFTPNTPSVDGMFDDGPTQAATSSDLSFTSNASRSDPIHLVVPAPPQRSPAMMYVGGAALVVAGTVLGFLYAPRAETPDAPPREQVLASDAAREAPPSLAVTAVPARARTALLQSTPPGASVFFASDLLGKTPLEVKLPEDGAERHLSVELPGFVSAHVLLHSDSPPVIVVPLEKAKDKDKEPERDPVKSKKKKKRIKKSNGTGEEESEVPIW